MATTSRERARIDESDIRLARAVVASAKRDSDRVDPHVAEIARLPLPEDKHA